MSIESCPADLLDRLETGAAAPASRRRAVRHLLSHCPVCRRPRPAIGDSLLLDGTREGAQEPLNEYQSELDRAVVRMSRAIVPQILGRDEGLERARQLVTSLEHRPTEARRLVGETDPRLAGALVDVLIARSRDLRRGEPARSFQYAQWAEWASRRSEQIEVRCRGLGELGNAQRILGDLNAAERSLDEALRLARRHRLDPLARAHLYSLRASLANYQRRFVEAVRWLRAAALIYHHYQDHAGSARALIKLGFVEAERGRTEAGIAATARALRSVLGLDAATLELLATHNLIYLTAELEEAAEAEHLLDRARPLIARQADAIDRLRFDWLGARIRRELGAADDAAERLEAVRQSFTEHELPYEAALVALDLAVAYRQLDRWTDLTRLLRQTADLFANLGVPRESLTALGLLAEAEQAVSGDLLRQLMSTVRAARRRGPALALDLEK
ncbi:MAG: hypothetical protein AAF481_12945 [Acidobacteriota bacterium]